MEQISKSTVPAISPVAIVSPAAALPLLSADEWAAQHYLQVDLGDKRLTKRAVQVAAQMAAQPDASLPEQAGSRAALDGSYRLLNNSRVTMELLLAPTCKQTLAAARQQSVVLFCQDSTELDLTGHRATTGLGPIGNGHGQGFLLHSTVAVAPGSRQVLGLAHGQVVVREPVAQPNRHRRHTAEGRVWATAAEAVGRPPQDVLWIHVSDRGSDSFAYMATCHDLGQHVLLRAYQNRALLWDGEIEPLPEQPVPHLLDYVRSLPPCADGGHEVHVEGQAAQPARGGQPARPAQPARQARVVLQWTQAKIKPSPHTEPEMRGHAPLLVWLLRVWEPEPPPGVEPLEWVLISSLPIATVADAHQMVDWYTCRWLCEDYHQCLKTGCAVEDSQLDDGADLQRLLGFCCPIAVRLLQLRQTARQQPDVPATAVVEQLMVQVLTLRRPRLTVAMTIGEFWQAVAGLGGHQGRRSDGAPGWRTLWRGWRKLSDLTEGARLWQRAPQTNECSP